ncbi:hypothetical protein [Aridibaculum aurantiacum]|uniref:hypothetical protein n=1 Tax=Aridibaculum aurantiacum TaxID=2810307 RepID=UPI001A97ACA8|nr:hypothetical protein [Aridibaculum aurantiacum]
MKAAACFILLIFEFSLCMAQPGSAARYEIDAKRQGVMPTDKDALPRSREFIRLDSTYYVGHMYEGMYKAERSSDYIGFRNAIPALRKSFMLFQRDYSKNMRNMFTTPENYMASINQYIDFLQISNSLKECYDNLEMADSVMWVLDQVDKYNFPKEHFAVTTSKAWTYHRNRFYTSDKFAFLKNTVEDNEKMAFGYCYLALARIEKNRPQNDVWFGPGQAESDKMSVYHYLALLHAYNKNYDSSTYYYERMVDGGSVSWNNYGNMKHEVGELSTAYEFINRDKYKMYEKMLREPYYYLPMLDVYAGRTKEAMSASKEAIEFAGSTPGFGWYNIALSRSYLYDGQLDSAEYALTKAADFKEIHIGTTLTQTQYDFTVNLLRLQLIDKKMAKEKFNNKGWWYSPAALYKVASLKVEMMMIQYVLINQLAANPERERTVYDLFCSESTTTWDEAYYLIKDFSPNFFIRKYTNYQDNDPRTQLTRYFTLFKHQLQWAKGSEDKAFEGYKKLANEVLVDTTFEKLFLGRLYEGMYKAHKDEGNDKEVEFYANTLYETYPQLMPFNNVKVKMKLNIAGLEDENTKEVVKELKKARVDWVNDADGNTAIATVNFIKKGDRYEATVNTVGGSNKPVVVEEKMIFKDKAGAGKELALRLFGKSGAMIYETRDAGN